MTALTVRRLLIDLEQPIARHWCGGDAFLTAWFNALSMSFPIGEQFFIDSVRKGFKALSPEKQAELQEEVQGFVGQEATHRRIHGLFNKHLKDQGLDNAWERRAEKRLAMMGDVDPRHPLGVTAANEHFTALFAEWLLARPELLSGCEPRLKAMWLWHSAEEAEHKSTAFDLYQALGGTLEWRSRWMKRVTWIFLIDTLRQTANNLQRDGTLWRRSTWASAWRHLLGKQGLLRQSHGAWRQYFQANFHPNQQTSGLSEQWLAENRDLYKPVGAAA
ncbi:metal-dependent hydrolase [Hydrogenophaga crassostreae]|uniref:Metal-dependent hydrolase n=1 Tax=Hydrogenophaga crassostreae TaxID=1763535 RepID=A0A167IH17_9BURK|nr:metal-dependent hydrolase [Hydrogenophaga crassostreae]AOW13118.1 metal-dependent hydrolase [Hydrogenophaga crassostreae]OAD42737.1 metal-dependent hydrolase [Hydrogenophaga crassostreae]